MLPYFMIWNFINNAVTLDHLIYLNISMGPVLTLWLLLLFTLNTHLLFTYWACILCLEPGADAVLVEPV